MTSQTFTLQENINLAAEIIHQSEHAIALTGAGISTPSGIPDFRSEDDGLWQRHDPWDVASLITFRHSPERFYNWFRPLAECITRAEPNAAHTALAELEIAGEIKAIITQNIDGLHQQAGSQTVYEVHGTINTLTCVSCYVKFETSDFLESYVRDGEIPHCRDCGHVLKPDAILFGEQLPAKIFKAAEKNAREADVMLVVGSSLEVMPVAGLPMRSVENGARLIIINNTPTYLDERAEVILRMDVAEVLPAILEGVPHG